MGIRSELRHAVEPAADWVLAFGWESLAEVPVSGLDFDRTQLQRHVQLTPPLAAGGEVDFPHEVVALHLRGRRRRADGGFRLEVAAAIAKCEPVVFGLPVDLLGAVSHLVLDLEEIGEVVSGGQAQLEAQRLFGEALQLDLLMESSADEAKPAHSHGVRAEARQLWVREEESGGVVIDRA